MNDFSEILTKKSELHPNKIYIHKINGRELTFLELENYEDIISIRYLKINVTTLPQLPYRLEKLYCTNMRLHHLPELPPTLVHLDCSSCDLDSLPELPNSLKKLILD